MRTIYFCNLFVSEVPLLISSVCFSSHTFHTSVKVYCTSKDQGPGKIQRVISKLKSNLYCKDTGILREKRIRFGPHKTTKVSCKIRVGFVNTRLRVKVCSRRREDWKPKWSKDRTEIEGTLCIYQVPLYHEMSASSNDRVNVLWQEGVSWKQREWLPI